VNPVTSEDLIFQGRLDSWKSIAQYLGRSSRTVQRWHGEFGLPIHRLGGKTGSVFAFADELCDWMRGCGRSVTDEPPTFGRPELVTAPHLHRKSETSSEVQDYSLIHDQAKAHSVEMLALARKMWEVLSYGNITVIARCFCEAIDVDPGNAEAYSGLSFAMIIEGLWGLVPPPAAYKAGREAAFRALEIDHEQEEAKCASDWLNMLVDRDWQSARRGLNETLKLQPQSICARIGRSLLYIAEGDFQTASDLLHKVSLENALSSQTASWYCWSKYLAGQYGPAINQSHQYRASGRSGPVVDAVEAMAAIQLEEPNAQIDRIEALLADSPHYEVLRGALGYAYGAAGQDQKAAEIFYSMMHSNALHRKHEPYALALVLIGLNRKKEAVEQLELSYREGAVWSLGFLYDPMLDALRNNPHFLLFMSKVSYPASEDVESQEGLTG
jgi:tetratricopeptide (TPR) repeat protein